MSREDVLGKLISIRHHCYQRGIIGRGGKRAGGDEDFRHAFRVVNRLYIEVKHERPGGKLQSRSRAHRRRAPQTCAEVAA